MLPLSDLFVDRTGELEQFASVLAGLKSARRRHLALLGLRRIGKTVLLDEVRRCHPSFPICYVALDDIVSSPGNFATNFVGQLLATASDSRGLADDRTTIGGLFEQRVENLVRQFGGQKVAGKYFGVADQILLPTVRQVQQVEVHDPMGAYGKGPDDYEVDLVTTGVSPEDNWAIECKHTRGAVTKRRVERFTEATSAAAKALYTTFAHRWIVTNQGIRSDAWPLIRAEGILTTSSRQLQQLERLAARDWKG